MDITELIPFIQRRRAAEAALAKGEQPAAQVPAAPPVPAEAPAAPPEGEIVRPSGVAGSAEYTDYKYPGDVGQPLPGETVTPGVVPENSIVAFLRSLMMRGR